MVCLSRASCLARIVAHLCGLHHRHIHMLGTLLFEQSIRLCVRALQIAASCTHYQGELAQSAMCQPVGGKLICTLKKYGCGWSLRTPMHVAVESCSSACKLHRIQSAASSVKAIAGRRRAQLASQHDEFTTELVEHRAQGFSQLVRQRGFLRYYYQVSVNMDVAWPLKYLMYSRSSCAIA